MKIKESGFEGLLIIEPRVFADSRGYFFESFNSKAFEQAGIDFKPVQDNESRSSRGVIRGLHYQLSPYAQAKLIRVVEGKIFDVGVDLRKNSPTFMKWFGMEIDSENKIQILMPKGFAHGFSVLSEYAVIQYKVDNLYNKESERGIIYDDPELGIDWRLGKTVPVISDKDRENRPLKEAEHNF